MITDRDYDYVQNRLSAPSVAAGEAHERLAKIGTAEATAQAEHLMAAMQRFQDSCRDVRQWLGDTYRQERRART